MQIHRQLTAAAFLFISMAIMAQVPFSKKEVKEKNEASGRLANFQS